ncbi:hypothetical protein F511_06832 [Dorcoceras hygrometricum]|uniref:Uncharacterized protein n=1 Tax=Dorcoceras hygrometricum TaxID=472368 RepID=A0A2Z7A925_9LAMI|nr:hypothetical protein F511_06832 [Dorcoceras hygrometricum]
MRRRAAAVCRPLRGRTCSDHLVEEIPFRDKFVSSSVQTDEGAVFPVVDRIRRFSGANLKLPMRPRERNPDPPLCQHVYVEEIREQVIEEISSFFSSFSLRRLAVLGRMISIAGSWTVIEGMDRWVRECSSTTSIERTQLLQEPAVTTLAPICIFVEPVQDPDSRPPFSGIWKLAKFCVDIVQFNIFGHLLPVGTFSLCRAIVAVGTIVDLEADPTEFLGVFRRRLDVDINFSSSSSTSSSSEHLNSSRASSSSDSRMLFTADDLHEIHSSDDVLPVGETPGAQISLPTAAYINRGRDDKKGEGSSSCGPQPPDDQNRPGDSGRGRGSRSEPPRKRGGSTSSRVFNIGLENEAELFLVFQFFVQISCT